METTVVRMEVSIWPQMTFELDLWPFRLYSFNQWIKTFDMYRRKAANLGITSPSKSVSCPRTISSLPCQGQLSDWFDLNNCKFAICNQTYEFRKLKWLIYYDSLWLIDVLDGMRSESIETITSCEEEYQVYKNYLFPQWNTGMVFSVNRNFRWIVNPL